MCNSVDCPLLILLLMIFEITEVLRFHVLYFAETILCYGFLWGIPFLYLQRSAKHRWLITGRLHLPIPLLWRGINSRLHAMMVTLSKKGSFHHLFASAMVPGIEYPPVLQMVPIGFFQQSLDPAVKQKTLVVEYFPLSVCLFSLL